MIFNKGAGTKDLSLMKKIATDLVVDEVIKNKTKECLKQNKAMNENKNTNADVDDDNDDCLSTDSISSGEREILDRLKEKYQENIKINNSKNVQKELTGVYLEKNEKDFFKLIENKKERIVCHFYHNDFQRCLILDKHLRNIAHKHQETLFIKINAQASPFLVQKLKLKILPAIYYFENGVSKDSLVGFEELGGDDGFKELDLSRRLAATGAIALNEDEHFKLNKKPKRIIAGESDSSDEEF